ncbi:MAG: cytochrome c biogenesis protein CcdA [Bacteroidales bacterium]
MRKTIILFILAGLILYLPAAFSQILEPVKWEFEKERSDDEINLVIRASIDTDWYMYGQDIPEEGPVPTSVHVDLSENFELLDKTEYLTEPYIKYDPFFDMDLPLFSNEAIFRQKIRVLTGKEFTVTGYIEYMSCDDERCLPPQEKEFEYTINPGASAPTESITGAETESETEPVEEVISDTSAGGRATIPPEVDKDSDAKESRSLWIFFIIAFAGGLAGLLTPCVFPMIPMTVSFFIQKQSGRLNSIINAFVFGISIIAIYTSLGLLVSATSVGAGFANQLTSHWLPNLIFFLLFVAFAASFFGMFEITLPGGLATRADRKAEGGGYVGSFFMALTLVIVSLSCVGPIVGALLVEAATGGGSAPIVGMFGFSLAFAIPFTLLAIFPSWMNRLPKSGGWLNSVKVVLGFIVLAFSLKFLLTVDQVYQFGILTRDIYLAIWIVLFSLLGLYLLGKIKFAHDSDLPHIGVPRLFLAIAVFSFVVYMIPGMFGAPLKSVSSLLPAQHTHSFDIRAMIRDAELNGGKDATLCEEPKYAGFLHLPHGLQGYFDLEQGLACAREQDKPVFIDFVGHGCSNCKVMEARVWSDPRVLQRLRNDYIIIALYVDDRTMLPEDEWITSEFDGRVKNTIGSKNLDYQITSFNTNTQPYYVLTDADGNLLNQPRGYNLDIEAFIEFLDTGLENFEGN